MRPVSDDGARVLEQRIPLLTGDGLAPIGSLEDAKRAVDDPGAVRVNAQYKGRSAEPEVSPGPWLLAGAAIVIGLVLQR